MIVSGLLFSDDCDRLRAFWAEPRMPSRVKFGVRPAVAAALSEVGDLIVLAPLAPAESCCGDGISTVKSRFGSGGYCLTTEAGAAAGVVMVAVTEWGESPLEEGDMVELCRPQHQADGSSSS